jgi:hypothetical protein
MKRLVAFVLGVHILTSATAITSACDCAEPPPPKKSLGFAHAVFTGKCVGTVVEGETLIATFEVDRVWKGEIGTKAVVRTHKSGASCGYGFSTKGDAAYFIYAHEVDGKAQLWTNLCTRTNTLADAKQDLKDLGDGSKPKEQKEEKK